MGFYNNVGALIIRMVFFEGPSPTAGTARIPLGFRVYTSRHKAEGTRLHASFFLRSFFSLPYRRMRSTLVSRLGSESLWGLFVRSYSLWGTRGDLDLLNKVLVKRAISRVKNP